MRNLLLIVALVLVAAGSSLFAPRPAGAEDYWGTYIQLSPRAGFILNYDSYGYIGAAARPEALLQAGEVRQSRPLYVLLGTVLGYPLRALLTPRVSAETVQSHFWNANPVPVPLPDLIGFYPAFVLLNFGVLTASLWLFSWLYPRLTAGRGQAVVMYGLMVFMASSQITKAFFWTAHQQMFCFFTPLFCLFLLLQFRHKPLQTGRLAVLALALGVLPLLYGNFVLVLPCLWYALWRQASGRFSPTLLGRGVMVAAAFLLPTLAWVLVLKLRGVTYYNHEMVRFRQLVWLIDLAKQPADEWLPMLWNKLREFSQTLIGIAFFLLVLPLLGLLTRLQRVKTLVSQPWPEVVFLLVLFGSFLVALGYYNQRLTFTLVPLLLCGAALLLSRLPARFQPAMIALAAIGWHLYNVWSYGPFS